MRHQQQMKYLDTVAKVGSIRRAAELLAISSSALNKRILAMEDDLGVPVFDRLASGVRLNAAGEILIHHFRTQIADMERVKSRIHDLQGVRRGHISISCSQVFMDTLLADEIIRYQRQHPCVTFSVRVCTRESATQDLRTFNADIALVFEPELGADFHTVVSSPQALHAQFHKRHELNQPGTVRLRNCLQWPQALPTMSNGIRHHLERSAAKLSCELNIIFESDNFTLLKTMVQNEDTITFNLTAGIQPENDSLCCRAIDQRDVPAAKVHVGVLKDRHLPIAAAKFVEQLSKTIDSHQEIPLSA